MIDLETALLGWLFLGALLAHANDKLVLKEMVPDRVERVNYFVRCTLAWPTYLVEDFELMRRMNGDEDD